MSNKLEQPITVKPKANVNVNDAKFIFMRRFTPEETNQPIKISRYNERFYKVPG